jgi:hypothetical protein
MLLSFLPRTAAQVKLPTRYAASKALAQLVSEHADLVCGRVADVVKGRGSFPGQFAVTTDAWTSRGVRGYLGVTLAYIDDAWVLQSPVVACTPLPPPHTGDIVAETIMQQLPAPAQLRHVCAIVTDNGANFVRATELLASNRGVRCVAHTI